MDIKWLAVAVIVVVATVIYVRTMRVHAHASWAEIVFPSRHRGTASVAIESAPGETKLERR